MKYHWKLFSFIFILIAVYFFPQIDGILHFEAREVLPQWDKQIQSLCFQVNGIIEKINTAHPEWVAKVMDEQMVQ